MKKHLIAAAVAAAVAAPAMAQNVTLYGIIDTGYTDFSAKQGGVSYDTKGVMQSANVSSRWGLRGSEDLGGGMKANFVVETGIAGGANAGSFADPNASRSGSGARRAGLNTQTDNAGGWVNTAAIGNRAMWAGISTSGGTEVRIGLQDTPIRTTALEYNADGTTNVVGNLLAGNSAGFADRANALSLTQTMGDIRGTIALMSKTYEPGPDAKEKANDGYALSLRYAKGPLSVGVAMANTKTEKNAVDLAGVCYDVLTGALTPSTDACAPSTSLVGINPATTGLFKSKNEPTVIGSNYDFGVARVSVAYGVQEFTRTRTSDDETSGETKVMTVGSRVPLGATTLFATYSDGKYQVDANSGNAETRRKKNQDGYVLGASYAMSKRTSLYAIYGTADIEYNATDKLEYRQISAGLVHNF